MDEKLVDYYIRETNRRLIDIETKVDKLLRFKWQIIGGSVLLSVIFTVAIQLATIVFRTNI